MQFHQPASRVRRNHLDLLFGCWEYNCQWLVCPYLPHCLQFFRPRRCNSWCKLTISVTFTSHCLAKSCSMLKGVRFPVRCVLSFSLIYTLIPNSFLRDPTSHLPLLQVVLAGGVAILVGVLSLWCFDGSLQLLSQTCHDILNLSFRLRDPFLS